MVVREPIARAESGFVELFATENSGAVFAYRLVGAAAGPQLVVAGTCPSAATVFERLLSIPTLPWMRGSLVLVRLDALEDVASDVGGLEPLGPVDRTIVLTGAGVGAEDEALARRNYHAVLRACAELGMIAGRGVARG